MGQDNDPDCWGVTFMYFFTCLSLFFAYVTGLLGEAVDCAAASLL